MSCNTYEDEIDPLQERREKAYTILRRFQEMPSSKFTVSELQFLLKPTNYFGELTQDGIEHLEKMDSRY